MPTTAIILQNAPIASVLANNAATKGVLFGGKLDPNLYIKIWVTWWVINRIYEADPTYPHIYEKALRLWEMMGRYGLAAYTYTGGGGGSVSPVTPIPTIPAPYYFVVSVSSFIPTGGSSATISAFIGFNLIFARGGIPQSQIQTEPTWFSWNSVTGAFVGSPALVEGELIALIPV